MPRDNAHDFDIIFRQAERRWLRRPTKARPERLPPTAATFMRSLYQVHRAATGHGWTVPVVAAEFHLERGTELPRSTLIGTSRGEYCYALRSTDQADRLTALVINDIGP